MFPFYRVSFFLTTFLAKPLEPIVISALWSDLFAMHDSPISLTGTTAPSSNPNSAVDDLVRTFNTALVSTRVGAVRDFSTELYTLVESPGFRAILTAVRQLARTQGLSEKEAAEHVIETFRKVDRIWSEYIYQEGVDRLKSQLNSGQ